MPTLLFHHNLRTFGGGHLRMPQFRRRYILASKALSHRPMIAGFTELSNATPLTLANLRGVAGLLNRNFLPHPVYDDPSYLVFHVGTSAVGNRREWIGIYWDVVLQPALVAGVILRNAQNRGWGDPLMRAPHEWPDDRRLSLAVGQAATLDSRGLAWIFTEVEGQPTIVAFMHNMYAIGEPSAAYDSLGAAIGKIQQALVRGGHSAAPPQAIIGGDFNIGPRNLNANERTHRTGLIVSAEQQGGAYVKTTQTHCYDYWFVTAGLPPSTPGVRVEVRSKRGFVSDHAAISLRVG